VALTCTVRTAGRRPSTTENLAIFRGGPPPAAQCMAPPCQPFPGPGGQPATGSLHGLSSSLSVQPSCIPGSRLAGSGREEKTQGRSSPIHLAPTLPGRHTHLVHPRLLCQVSSVQPVLAPNVPQDGAGLAEVHLLIHIPAGQVGMQPWQQPGGNQGSRQRVVEGCVCGRAWKAPCRLPPSIRPAQAVHNLPMRARCPCDPPTLAPGGSIATRRCR